MCLCRPSLSVVDALDDFVLSLDHLHVQRGVGAKREDYVVGEMGSLPEGQPGGTSTRNLDFAFTADIATLIWANLLNTDIHLVVDLQLGTKEGRHC